MNEDLAALARHALGHASITDQARILRMAGEDEEGESKPWEQPSATGDESDTGFDANARPTPFGSQRVVS